MGVVGDFSFWGYYNVNCLRCMIWIGFYLRLGGVETVNWD